MISSAVEIDVGDNTFMKPDIEKIKSDVDLEALMPLIEERIQAGQSVKFSPHGVSMLPMIVPGRDSVILSQAPEKLKRYDLPLYRRADGSFVLHRVVKAGEKYVCIGDNQFKFEGDVSHSQVIAVVTKFVRDGHEISVKSFGYKLYCRAWHLSRPFRYWWRRGIGFVRRAIKKRFS